MLDSNGAIILLALGALAVLGWWLSSSLETALRDLGLGVVAGCHGSDFYVIALEYTEIGIFALLVA